MISRRPIRKYGGTVGGAQYYCAQSWFTNKKKCIKTYRNDGHYPGDGRKVHYSIGRTLRWNVRL